jgi:hypothetical protein
VRSTRILLPDRLREPYRDQRPGIASCFGMIANFDHNIRELDAVVRETVTCDLVFDVGCAGRKSHPHAGLNSLGTLGASGDIDGVAQAQEILWTLFALCTAAKPAWDVGGAPWQVWRLLLFFTLRTTLVGL